MQNIFNHSKIHIKDKNNLENKIKGFKLKNLQIVADFDSTITQDNEHTTWSLIGRSGMMPDEYNTERHAFFAHYYPFEIDATLSFEVRDSLMREWWQKHLELFIKYELNINVINNAIKESSFIDFRYGMKEFLDISVQKNVPFLILSAGLTNIIDEFLKYKKTNYPNIHIVSNELIFDEQGICTGINKDSIIHSENKDEHDMPEHVQKMVLGKTDIILIGDSLSDVKMIDEKYRGDAIKIGFLGDKRLASKELFIDNFDIVVENNFDSMDVPRRILELLS